jgi:catechol 2,3-dioxygenase-like lactoylglutathione lyase family enzyme
VTISLNRIYHPSHRVVDLGETEDFFRRVFGRYSLPRAGLIMAGIIRQPEGYPSDYCAFTPIADVYFDSIDPDRYIWSGTQPYPSISAPHLNGYGWAVDDGMQEVWDACRAAGIRLTDQWNNVIGGSELPSASFKATPLYWTHEEDTGLRYEFYPTTSIQSYDPRSLPDWQLPVVSRDDPLGIVRASHHTVLTADPNRASTLFVDILGGKVVTQKTNPAWGTESTFISLAGDIHEIAVVGESATSAVARDLGERLPLDSYYSISFLVADLERTVAHLRRCDVDLQWQSANGVVTDPKASIGVSWGFYEIGPYDG